MKINDNYFTSRNLFYFILFHIYLFLEGLFIIPLPIGRFLIYIKDYLVKDNYRINIQEWLFTIFFLIIPIIFVLNIYMVYKEKKITAFSVINSLYSLFFLFIIVIVLLDSTKDDDFIK